LPQAVAPLGFAQAFSHAQLASYSITTDAVLVSKYAPESSSEDISPVSGAPQAPKKSRATAKQGPNRY
jgi:hypothetical protein